MDDALLASRFGITSGAASDVLRKHGLKPHVVRTYEVSGDPQFAAHHGAGERAKESSLGDRAHGGNRRRQDTIVGGPGRW
ncbi:MAG TPA: hypothetical protein VG963_18570 [Polyangiaceae bacterium]|nr:hypothetical protein [Polyangiaceae bacterium]